MRTVIAVAALASLSAIGCVQKPGNYYDVYVSPDMTHEQLNATFDALTDWEEHTPVIFNISVKDHFVASDEGYAFSIHTDPNPSSHCGGWTSGYACTDRPNVYGIGVEGNTYMPQSFGYYWKHAVEHEIGHDLGLEHTAEGTLMYRMDEGAAYDITAADVKQFYEVRGEPVPELPATTH